MDRVERLAERLVSLPEGSQQRALVRRELVRSAYESVLSGSTTTLGTVPEPTFGPESRADDIAYVIATLGSAIRVMEQRREQLRVELRAEVEGRGA